MAKDSKMSREIEGPGKLVYIMNKIILMFTNPGS